MVATGHSEIPSLGKRLKISQEIDKTPDGS